MTFQTIFANGVNPFPQDLSEQEERKVHLDRHFKVAEYIKTHPSCSFSEIKSGTAFTHDRARYSLTFWRRRNRLVPSGIGYATRYSWSEA